MAGYRLMLIVICMILTLTCVHADFAFGGFGVANEPIIGLKLVGNATYQRCNGVMPSVANGSAYKGWSINGTTANIEAVVAPGICATGVDCRCNASVIALTEARRDQAGGVWHITKQMVAGGFATKFQFRLTNQSQICEQRISRNDDRSALYAMCSNGAPPNELLEQGLFVPGGNQDTSSNGYNRHLGDALAAQRRGGDGFAFVIQNSDSGSAALGRNGDGLGYDGITNGIAVEFDTFANLDGIGDGDDYTQHISVHAGGADTATTVVATRLAHTTASSLPIFGDGAWHWARIVYYPTIMTQYLSAFAGSDRLKSYIHTNPGTLCIFLDNLVSPAICVPLSLSSLISLDSGRAYVGFTAATGLFFQTHEIFKWTFCTADITSPTSSCS